MKLKQRKHYAATSSAIRKKPEAAVLTGGFDATFLIKDGTPQKKVFTHHYF